MTDRPLARSYQWCETLARRHYENFPVASRMLPRRLRRPVTALYAFARTADDLADEGELSTEQRLAALSAMETAVGCLARGEPADAPWFPALKDTVQRHGLPLPPLLDLLSAFRQDVTKGRYADFGELMDYCRRSANPVGRLLLHLFRQTGPQDISQADAICSALQLTNFLQDIGQDYEENDRIYLPRDEMERFGVEERDIAERRSTPALAALVRFQAQRAFRLLRAGSPLGKTLPGRLGLELRMIILGGQRILERLQSEPRDLFRRPRLGRRDHWALLWGALRHSL